MHKVYVYFDAYCHPATLLVSFFVELPILVCPTCHFLKFFMYSFYFSFILHIHVVSDNELRAIWETCSAKLISVYVNRKL